MTRDEFMEEAQKEIDQVLLTHKNRLMNLVMKAWAEGKRNAEAEQVQEIGTDIFEMLKEKLVGPATVPIEWPKTDPGFDGDKIVWSNIPDSCKYCRNHPSNGGSGICHCILGSQTIT